MIAPDVLWHLHTHTHTLFGARYPDGTAEIKKGARRSRRTPTIRTRNGKERRRAGHGTSFDSFRRAPASDADAIPSNSSSRSIEVHGRKQAPFYPVHSRQRERWTNGGGAPRARRDERERETERACTRSSLLFPPLSPLSLFLQRLATSRTDASRESLHCIIYISEKNLSKTRRVANGSAHSCIISPLSHCRLLHCEITGATEDTFRADLLRA